jgi:glutamyl-Q tRNA(Asp) synthetase
LPASDPTSPEYVGRFAPSPTGPLHFGSLIAALASYADARAADGRWLLRIEDLDPPREQPGAAGMILRTLERFGFEWDGPVRQQSDRGSAYLEAFEGLQRDGWIFPCACTRLELRRGRLGVGGERVYPGHCRHGLAAGRAARAWRLRVDDEPVVFTDRVQGPQAQLLERDVGDFVIRRADRQWAYQLAVVVDDADQRITDVVRGADLLASTPRQIYLQRLLRLPSPRHAHVPVAVNINGEKLSKQTKAAALAEDRPERALMAAWRFLDQAEIDADVASAQEFWAWAIPRWNAARIPPVPMLPAPPAGVTDRGAL